MQVRFCSRLVFRLFASVLLASTVTLTGAGAQRSVAGPATEPYSLSFAAGKRDAHGNFLGGTELLNLVPHNGKLYAGVGYWMDRPAQFDSNDPRSAAQILVLDSKGAHWRQEFSFDDQNSDDEFKYHRLSAMQVLKFHRFDSEGHVVGDLAEVFAAGLDSPLGAVFTQVSSGRWEDTHIPTTAPVRSLAVYYDPVDRIEKVFAGPGGGQDRDIDHAIYSGVYDPSAPGKIRWDPTPERTGIESRVMSIVNCGGALFAAAKPSIFRRNDADRRWDRIYSYPVVDDHDMSMYASGFRGLTCIDNPDGSGGKTLLTGFEGVSGDIMRIDPKTGEAVYELKTRQFLASKWGSPPVKPDIIPGYNDAVMIQSDPETRIFTLLVRSPNEDEDNSAWFLSRTPGPPPDYTLHQVRALRWPNRRSDPALWSVRAIAVSPFPEDRGQVLYLGGYDGHFQPDHNTAWLYRVGIDTALKPYDNAGQ